MYSVVDSADVICLEWMDSASTVYAGHHGSEEIEVVDCAVVAVPGKGALLPQFLVRLACGPDGFEVGSFDVLAFDFLADPPFADVIGSESFALVGSVEGVDPAWEGRGALLETRGPFYLICRGIKWGSRVRICSCDCHSFCPAIDGELGTIIPFIL